MQAKIGRFNEKNRRDSLNSCVHKLRKHNKKCIVKKGNEKNSKKEKKTCKANL